MDFFQEENMNKAWPASNDPVLGRAGLDLRPDWDRHRITASATQAAGRPFPTEGRLHRTPRL